MRASDERTVPKRSSPSDHWRPGLGELLAGAAHEVPPHQEGFGEGKSTEQQGPGRGPDIEPALVPTFTQIRQQAGFGHPVPDGDGAFQDDEGVLALRSQREHRPRRVEDEVDAKVIGVAPGR